MMKYIAWSKYIFGAYQLLVVSEFEVLVRSILVTLIELSPTGRKKKNGIYTPQKNLRTTK